MTPDDAPGKHKVKFYVGSNPFSGRPYYDWRLVSDEKPQEIQEPEGPPADENLSITPPVRGQKFWNVFAKGFYGNFNADLAEPVEPEEKKR